jgi:hypothetical protein
LADFGADVIKVERPDTGDSLRGMAWRDPRDGEGLWWKLVNRNKRNIALDFKNEEDLALLRKLLDDAQVLVENFRPGTLERLGLAPEELLKRNPKLVIVRVSGFGQDGPYSPQFFKSWAQLFRSTNSAENCSHVLEVGFPIPFRAVCINAKMENGLVYQPQATASQRAS